MNFIDLQNMKDKELKNQIAAEMGKKGVMANLQARLLHETCSVISDAKSGTLSSLEPQIKVEPKEDAWEEAICLVVAYLKRYKMKETVQTMRLEFTPTPNHTGYKKGSEVDDIFESLFDLIDENLDETFEQKVEKFIQTAQIAEPIESPKQKRTKK